jgi:pyruvate,orthophosphate dikinase
VSFAKPWELPMKDIREKKWVYFFSPGNSQGGARMLKLLGGKGGNLAEIAKLGIPVPPGFTITTKACVYFNRHKGSLPQGLRAEVKRNLHRLEEILHRKFGQAKAPLLLSVRSGAPVSMPGMMDTILNLGLNEQTSDGLGKETGDSVFALDCYQRLIQMYADVVLRLKPDPNEERNFQEPNPQNNLRLQSAQELNDLILKQREGIRARTGSDFPQDPWEQLWTSIKAVLFSWDNPRAQAYRQLNQISHDLGTAVTIQAMVFGNLGEDSATGVAFTRNPSTGDKGMFGEFLLNAQGEEVVAGTRTPQQLSLKASQKWAQANNISEEERRARFGSMEEALPRCFRELTEIGRRLERHFRDLQDIEFTIEKGRLWVLQTRSGKRTAQAAVKIAVDLVKERKINQKTAILRVQPNDLNQLLHPVIDAEAKRDVLARGLPASPGAASGHVVFEAQEAETLAQKGMRVILVREETSPEDIRGMHAAQGILTARGGMTSHAAVIARGMGRCCIVGCEAVRIIGHQEFSVGERIVRKGDLVTLDGSTGEIMLGSIPTVKPKPSKEFHLFMGWADRFRRLKVRANADTPADAETAREFGAEGIGLCRTEHMFFEGERIDVIREMILAGDAAKLERAIAKILPIQRQDFVGIFERMAGLPVTIRLLDPPLHEFLPHGEGEIRSLASKLGVPFMELEAKVQSLKEVNPMLGHRGCRLGITFPEIYRMQVRAIMEAACEVASGGISVQPEIMIPLVAEVREFKQLREDLTGVIKEVLAGTRVKIPYLLGTMIELPRAALTAGEIAREADFFSFGTNDLTQTTFGISRDDGGKFLPTYLEREIIKCDPFVSLDTKGVGELIQIAVLRGRKTRKKLKIGICGEHAGDPDSVRFCHETNLDYVSCSAYRVPISRLAAAQAALTS